MPDMLPWDIVDLEYDGLCSHSPLIEGVAGEEHGLSPEQLARKQVAMEARRKASQLAGQRKYDAKIKSTKSLRDRKNATIKRSQDKRIAAKKHWCETCEKPFQSDYALETHKKGIRHLEKLPGYIPPAVKNPGKKARREAIRASKKHYCAICDDSFTSPSELRQHQNGRDHKLLLARELSSDGS